MVDNLPIERLDAEGLEDIRRGILNVERLGAEEISTIRKLYDLTGNNNGARLLCDEAHQHSYSCLEFDDPHSAVVRRLLDEVERYRSVLDNIKSEVQEARGK